jgi:hypothetical protein
MISSPGQCLLTSAPYTSQTQDSRLYEQERPGPPQTKTDSTDFTETFASLKSPEVTLSV